MKLYRKLPHIILQRVSHFRGRVISTSCLPNTLTFYALTLYMKFFVTLFSATIYSRIMKLYRKLPHIMLQRVSHFRGRAISTSCLPNTLTFYALTLYMKFFVAFFSTTTNSRILKLYRKLPHTILQRVSHFRGRVISTSCLPNTLTFLCIDIVYEIFRHTFLSNCIQQDHETLQEASTHHAVACKPFSWSCHIHFLFAEYFNILRIDIEYEIFRRTFLNNYIQQDHETLQEASAHHTVVCKPFSWSCHIHFLFSEYFYILRIDVVYEIFRRTFLSNYIQQDHETLQEASTHHTVACKPFSWSCHIHFLFAEYFNILRIDIEYEIFRRTFLNNYIQQDLETLQESSTHHTVAYKPFSWSCHVHFLFAEYF